LNTLERVTQQNTDPAYILPFLAVLLNMKHTQRKSKYFDYLGGFQCHKKEAIILLLNAASCQFGRLAIQPYGCL